MISLPELPLQVFIQLTATKESNWKDISLLNSYLKKYNPALHLLKRALLSRDTNF